jgi:hypothetical protein
VSGVGGRKSNLIKNRSAPLSPLSSLSEYEALFGSKDFQDIEQRRREEQFKI